MKKQFLIAAAVAALMTCACSVEPVDIVDAQPEEGEITVLTAGFGFDEDKACESGHRVYVAGNQRLDHLAEGFAAVGVVPLMPITTNASAMAGAPS